MIHTRFDFDGALRSAQKAVERTKTERFIVLTAIGYRITKLRPQIESYDVWRVAETGLEVL